LWAAGRRFSIASLYVAQVEVVGREFVESSPAVEDDHSVMVADLMTGGGPRRGRGIYSATRSCANRYGHPRAARELLRHTLTVSTRRSPRPP